MTPTFVDTNRHLLLRYSQQDMRTFNFSRVQTNATAAALHGLAVDIGDIQSAKPSKITTTVTRHLII